MSNKTKSKADQPPKLNSEDAMLSARNLMSALYLIAEGLHAAAEGIVHTAALATSRPMEVQSGYVSKALYPALHHLEAIAAARDTLDKARMDRHEEQERKGPDDPMRGLRLAHGNGDS